eukprot:gene7650-10412_t
MSRVYVGNLPIDIKESEIDDLFYKYGRIKDIDLKTPARPPAFAFITFDDSRDAEDAVRGRDGYSFDGYRLRVEFAKGSGGGGGSRYPERRDPPRGGGGGRRTDYGVVVSNLPRSCSWQDLKDFMRKAGDVVYTDVGRDGDGVVEFSNRDDMEYAVRSLDDTEFKHYNETTFIRVRFVHDKKRDRSDSDRGRSRKSISPSPRRSKSRSRSRDRARKSVSRSPSPDYRKKSPRERDDDNHLKAGDSDRE